MNRVEWRFQTPAEGLKELRARAGIPIRQMAVLVNKKLATYEHYESTKKRGDKPLPVWLVQRAIPVLVGRGDPPISEKEIVQLAGVKPLTEKQEKMVNLTDRLSKEEYELLLKQLELRFPNPVR